MHCKRAIVEIESKEWDRVKQKLYFLTKMNNKNYQIYKNNNNKREVDIELTLKKTIINNHKSCKISFALW